MKRRIVKLSLIVLAIPAFIILMGAQNAQEWVVPAKFKTMKNPTSSSKENLANAKELYSKHCKSCHGAIGLGDGSRAASLDATCGDFSTAKFQAQTDGDIFYKITEGRGKMPSFKKTIADDNDRWMLCYYLRTFKSK
jgi:mono/diheme cytochrome c family protein